MGELNIQWHKTVCMQREGDSMTTPKLTLRLAGPAWLVFATLKRMAESTRP